MTSWLSVMAGYSVTSAITSHTITDLLSSGALMVLFLDAYSNAAFFVEWVFSLFLMIFPTIFFLALGFIIGHGAASRLSHI